MLARSYLATVLLLFVVGLHARGGGGGGRGGRGDDDSDEPGCCYGADVKCQTESKTTCDKMAKRKGCEWRSGESADCTPPTPEPGCCYGGGVCEDADNSYCTTNRKAKKAGCAWISGADADCTPLPGCCAGTSSNCFGADESYCGSRQGIKAGCEWMVGTHDAPPDCEPTTTKLPEAECTSGDSLLMTGWVSPYANLNDEYAFGGVGPSGFGWYQGVRNRLYLFVDVEFGNVHIEDHFTSADAYAWCPGSDIAACTAGRWFPAGEGQSRDPNAGLEECEGDVDDSDDSDDESGCCWGPPTGTETGCSSTTSSTIVDSKMEPIVIDRELCEKRTERLGCEWISGEDANCEPEVCCFGHGEFCTNSPTGGIHFLDGTRMYCEDCMKLEVCIDEPFVDGCCYGGATECFVGDDQNACEANAAEFGCEWREGVDSCQGCCVADWSLRDSDPDEFRSEQDTCDVAGTDDGRCSYYMDRGQCGWVGADQIDVTGEGGIDNQYICDTVKEEFSGVGCCIPTSGGAPWDMMVQCNKFGKSECWQAFTDGNFNVDPDKEQWASHGQVCFWVNNQLCPDWTGATEEETAAVEFEEVADDRLFKDVSEEAQEISAQDIYLLAGALLLIAAVAMYAMHATCAVKSKKSVRGAADEKQPLIH